MKDFDLRRGDEETKFSPAHDLRRQAHNRRKTGKRGEKKDASTPPFPHSPIPVKWGKQLQACRRVLLLALAFSLAGCGFYSFTGATIPQRFETVAIPLAEDAGSPFSSLGAVLTESLIERFAGRTRLALADNENDADVVLTTRISGYESTPVSVSGGGRAQLVEVRLAVEARYHDTIRDSTLLRRTFTGSEEYNPVGAGPGAERQAAAAALEDIADDIFNAATSNW